MAINILIYIRYFGDKKDEGWKKLSSGKID